MFFKISLSCAQVCPEWPMFGIIKGEAVEEGSFLELDLCLRMVRAAHRWLLCDADSTRESLEVNRISSLPSDVNSGSVSKAFPSRLRHRASSVNSI